MRIPGATQHEVVRCRPEIVPTNTFLGGPGSAMHRYALHRVRDTCYPSRFSVPLTSAIRTKSDRLLACILVMTFAR